jgi:hypothetical protein
VQAVADEKARVIVHESDQVDAAVLSLQDESEQIGLPQLVGPGPLEVPHRRGVRVGRRLLQFVAGLAQDAGDGLGAGGGPGPLQRQHAARNSNAAPVKFSALFGPVCPEFDSRRLGLLAIGRRA